MDTRSRLHNALARSHVPKLARHRLRPLLDQRGQPKVVSGDQAVVAQMTRSDGALRALRIPLSPDSGRGWPAHYGMIHDQLPDAVKLWFPRAIDVLDGGLPLGSQSVPAVLMEWIDGPTLLQAAHRAATDGNAAVLRALADALRDLAESFQTHEVVHGDLAADNLIVRVSGELVAVDLDSLAWTGYAPRSMHEPTMVHRFRGRRASGAQQDAFATLVLYVSLMLLAEMPELRERHGDPPTAHGGAILFSSWDLADPATSRVFTDVRRRVDDEARRLVDLLRQACLSEAAGIPDILAEAFDGAPLSPHAAATWSEPGQVAQKPEPKPATSTWDLSRVIDRIASQEDGFVQTVRKPEPVLPAAPDPVLAERARLREAIARGDDAEVLRSAVRLADDPVAQLYKIDVERVLAVGYQKRIADAARQQRDELVLQIAAEAELRHLPMSQASRRLIRQSRERLDVRDRLQVALADNDRTSLADLAVSGDLVVLGDTDRESLQQVLRALEWPNMQRALETDNDLIILEAFDEELFGGPEAVPTAVRHRVNLATARLAWIRDVRAGLKQRNVIELARLFATAPPGGAERLSAAERQRAERMIQQQAALDGLETAIRTGNDGEILTSLHEVERVGARIEDAFIWSSLRHVVERASLVERILDAARADPVDDRQLAHLLPVAKTLGLMHDPSFHDDVAWDMLELRVMQGAAMRRIRRALATDDDHLIAQTAWPDVAGAVPLLTSAERLRVEDARDRRKRRS